MVVPFFEQVSRHHDEFGRAVPTAVCLCWHWTSTVLFWLFCGVSVEEASEKDQTWEDLNRQLTVTFVLSWGEINWWPVKVRLSADHFQVVCWCENESHIQVHWQSLPESTSFFYYLISHMHYFLLHVCTLHLRKQSLRAAPSVFSQHDFATNKKQLLGMHGSFVTGAVNCFFIIIIIIIQISYIAW